MSDDLNIKSEINQLIIEYANIRRKFEICKKKHPKYLEGNDNYIGIIGEYWATIFLEQEHKDAIQDYLKTKTNKNHSEKDKEISYSKSKEWLDFIAKHDDKNEFISVKAISSENKQGTSGKIKYPSWRKKPTGKYILSVIIVKLDENLLPENLLYIDDMDSYLEGCIGSKGYNYSNHWGEDSKDLVFKYYKHGGFDKIFSSKIWKWKDDKFIQR